ncbi:MAG TPA: T9SS type A sorting domain-containing protein [Chitinophagales bacterium]|nr:T9SS type A sorting domain-containing protein [Chitinophagales bacterium]
MKQLLPCILLIAMCELSFAQTNPLVKQWDYSYGGYEGDFISQLLATPDGGFLAAGISQSDALFEKSEDNWDGSMFPTYDNWLIKCDANGTKQWDKTLGGTNDDFFYSVINTSDSGFLVIGSTRSPASGNITQSPIGIFDLWAVKLDASGIIEWDQRYGGNSSCAGTSAVQLPDGGYLLGGYTNSAQGDDVSEPSYGVGDFWIIRTDDAGNKLWDKRYGGSEDESVYAVFIAADGGFMLAGVSLSNASGLKSQDNYVNGKSDMWFVKTDSLGNYEWDKIIGSLDNDQGMDIVQAPGNKYLLATTNWADAGGDKTQTTQGAIDWWVVKTDDLMNVEWDLSIGGTGHEDDFGNVLVTAAGDYIIAGTSYSEANFWKSVPNNGPENTWIVVVDSNGNKLWDKTVLTGYSHTETGFGIQLTDGCYIFANDGDGFTDQEKTDQSFSFDYWCIKFCDTTTQQPPVSSVSFSASQNTMCEKFCISYSDSSTNSPLNWQWFFPGGNPSFSTEQNPGNVCYNDPGTFDVTLITTSAGANDTLTVEDYITVYPTPPLPVITQDAYVLTSSPAFSYQWLLNTVNIPGATNQSYTVLQSGLYTVLTSNEQGCISSSDWYVSITGTDDLAINSSVSIYPNPSAGSFVVELNKDVSEETDISITNAIGQVIYHADKMMVPHFEINLATQPDGIYFLQFKSQKGIDVTQIVIVR